jgi:hypothetical protein
MKNLLILTFASAALIGCSGGTQTSAPAAARATTTDAPADAKAKEVLASVGGMLHGGDPNGRYELGEALPLHQVSPSALRECGSSCAPEVLLPGAVDRIYPVLLEGRVVGSITLHQENGAWQPSAIGQGPASGRLVEARNELRRTQHADNDSYALVHVVGLNERFMAHSQQSSMLLTSLRKGQPLAPKAAKEVLADLVARAK